MASILLVEDDPDKCAQYALYLRSPDGGSHQVVEARSATIAVRELRRAEYDLVLLDVMMAYQEEDEQNREIDDSAVDYGRKMGLYVYREARKLPKPPRIALVTVVREAGVLSEFPEAVGYLSKYFSLDDLALSVKAWLRR